VAILGKEEEYHYLADVLSVPVLSAFENELEVE